MNILSRWVDQYILSPRLGKHFQIAAAAAFALGLIVGSAAAAPPRDLDRAKLDALFDSLAERSEAMGSVAIVQDSHVLYQRAIGYRYILADQSAPATPDTQYRLASVTKTFTATMIFQLIEEGKLTLATTLDTYYPNAPNGNLVTIADMLSHRSGLHDFTRTEDADRWLGSYQTREQMVAHVIDHPPDFRPGEQSAYSNSNYLLLGYILEQIEGKPYPTILESRITSKIGLHDTYYGEGKPNVQKNDSLSYRFDGGWTHVSEDDLSNPAGAGAIVSTPTDLAKFIDALFSGQLVAPSSLDRMSTITDGTFGMGLLPMSFGDHLGYGHTGAIDASRSSVTYYPQEHLAIAYCTNGQVYRMENILRHVASICFDEPFGISANRFAVVGTATSVAFCALLVISVFVNGEYKERRLLY